MAVQFGDINVVVTDLGRSLAFYRDALGLSEVGREEGAVRLSHEPVTVLILPFAREANDVDAYPNRSTISFDVVVDDLQATVARLESAGGRRVADIDDGMGWAVADPDGNIIEVIHT